MKCWSRSSKQNSGKEQEMRKIQMTQKRFEEEFKHAPAKVVAEQEVEIVNGGLDIVGIGHSKWIELVGGEIVEVEIV